MSQFAGKSNALAKPRLSGKVQLIFYKSKMGVDEYVRQVARATPMQIVEIERVGVIGSFIKDLSKRMGIPSSRIFAIFGIL